MYIFEINTIRNSKEENFNLIANNVGEAVACLFVLDKPQSIQSINSIKQHKIKPEKMKEAQEHYNQMKKHILNQIKPDEYEFILKSAKKYFDKTLNKVSINK